MAGSLSLSLNDVKDLSLDNQAKNIITNIGDAFSKAVQKGAEKISMPDNLSTAVKEGLKKINLQDIGGKAAESALKEGLKKLGITSTTFSSVKGVIEAVKEGDLKKGISNGINIAINALKVPNAAKTLLKDGKNLIVDKLFEDELKTLMKKQQNTISRIDKRCKEMEEAFKTNDVKTLDKLAKSLKTDVKNVMPIQDVIKRGSDMINRYDLYKSKNGQELTSAELELCKKL
jgi:hypothetical protein